MSNSKLVNNKSTALELGFLSEKSKSSSNGGRFTKKIAKTALFGLSAIALAVTSACAETPMNTLDPQSPMAEDIDGLFKGVLMVAALVFVLVQGGLLYMSRKFRVKPPKDESELYPDEDFPHQTHGNTRLEIGWTILPAVIMAVVAFFTLSVLFKFDDVTANENRQIQSVTVVGQQWWWEFQYHLDDDGIPDIVTANELVLPTGEEIHIDVTSRDVVHSFWIPVLNGKRDAVPGRLNWWTIETVEPGRYIGECTEFCGLSHAYMEKAVVSIPLEEWKVWAENQKQDAKTPEPGSLEEQGWQVFAANCSSCHVVNGLTSMKASPDNFSIYDGANRLIDEGTQVAGAAPNLTHFASRASYAGGIFDLYKNAEDLPYLDLAAQGDLNRGQLEAWIKDAPSQKANAWDSPGGPRGMTPFASLSDQEIDALVAFLTSLD